MTYNFTIKVRKLFIPYSCNENNSNYIIYVPDYKSRVSSLRIRSQLITVT